MKNILKVLLVVLLFTVNLFAQSNQPVSIKGTMDIRFDARNKVGSADRYAMNVIVCDSAAFHGAVTATPFVGGYIQDTLGHLDYDIACDVMNPKNTSQVANVGKLYGSVPVDAKNVYRFGEGSLRIGVLKRGMANSFESKFGGFALGKAPQSTSYLARAKESLSFSKNGKTISVSKYDKMEFQNHVLAAGPVQAFPEVTVNGSLVYDYARSAWYMQGITANYAVDGKQLVDKLSGTIRWVESPTRKTSGEGWYEFDVRFNEPAAGENAVFAAAQDESAFFETDATIPSLTGTMKYKDSMAGDTVIASAIQIDLNGNKMTKQQAMYICKLIMISSIVPLNAE